MGLPSSVKAINLGCGLSIAPGWINVDNSPNARLSKYPLLKWFLWKLGILSDHHYSVKWPASIETYDVRKKLPFADSSIDYVYTSHFLEHISYADAHRLVKEIFRLLKPCGVVRIVVPDLAIGARQYLAAMEANPKNAKAAPDFLNWLQLVDSGVRGRHLWMYDAPSLSAMLEGVGFIHPVVCGYQKGRVPDCDILDNRPEESLYLEAEKPALTQQVEMFLS